MLVFGMPFDFGQDRPQERADRVHVDGIWQRYDVYRSGHVIGSRYPLPVDNPFDDWHVNQRYANRSDFDLARVQGHENGARLVRGLVNLARMEGLT